MEMKRLKSDLVKQGFDRFIDPGQVKDLLQQQLPSFSDGRLIITSCTRGYTKYKTYENPLSYGKSTLSICYYLHITDFVTKKSGKQLLYAKVYLENHSQIEFEKIKTCSFVVPQYGEPFVSLPECDMIVWAFPNDPVLSHLPKCADPEKVKPYFPYDHLPSGLNGPEDILKVDAEAVHYRPENRCTTRYHLQWGLKDGPEKITLFGKTFKDDQGKALFSRSDALFRKTQCDPDSFLIAQPLDYNEQIKTVWQAGLDGKPLAELIDKMNYQHLIKTVAKGLAVFHKSGLHSPTQITMTEHLIEIKKKIAKLIRAFPQFSEPLQRIDRRLAKDSTIFSPVSDTIIHADFSVQQLLVCGDKIACFDFDEFAMGDPTQDVANFIVDCHFRSFAPDFVPLIISTFVHAYEHKAGFSIPMNGLNWYVQVLFVTKVYRFYLQQRPRLEDEIKAILTQAQEKIFLGEQME